MNDSAAPMTSGRAISRDGTNPGGKPATVARVAGEIRSFFAAHAGSFPA
jgi:hypothetical protein